MTHSFPTRRASYLFGGIDRFYGCSRDHRGVRRDTGRHHIERRGGSETAVRLDRRCSCRQLAVADGDEPPARAGGDRNMAADAGRSEEHTSELQSLMRISYAVFCLKKKNRIYKNHTNRK